MEGERREERGKDRSVKELFFKKKFKRNEIKPDI